MKYINDFLCEKNQFDFVFLHFIEHVNELADDRNCLVLFVLGDDVGSFKKVHVFVHDIKDGVSVFVDAYDNVGRVFSFGFLTEFSERIEMFVVNPIAQID